MSIKGFTVLKPIQSRNDSIMLTQYNITHASNRTIIAYFLGGIGKKIKCATMSLKKETLYIEIEIEI